MSQCNSLETFYEKWSQRSDALMKHDIECGVQKAEVVLKALRRISDFYPKSIVEIGCGYGSVLATFTQRYKPTKAIGFDYSHVAIDIAKKLWGKSSTEFEKLPSLSIEENLKVIQSHVGERCDCVLLFDVLEHIPDVKNFILALSKITTYFVIKLPLEKTFFDNLIYPKLYPSSVHTGGHLREFDVNTVHYFIRRLGLTPIIEGVYKYKRLKESFPPPPPKSDTVRYWIIFNMIKCFKRFWSFVLPKRLFLYFIGGGAYYCVATFNKEHMLLE